MKHLSRGVGGEEAPLLDRIASAGDLEVGEWTPLATHREALIAISEDPDLAASKSVLARAIGLDSSTVRRWFRDPDFLAWWNRANLEIARASLGPMVVELRRLVHSPDVSAGDKVRAVEAVVRIVGQPEKSFGAAVVAILERWSGRGSLKIAARGEAVAMELTEIGGPLPPIDPRAVEEIELEGGGSSTLEDHEIDPAVIAEAVQTSPLTLERAARSAVGKLRSSSRGRGSGRRGSGGSSAQVSSSPREDEEVSFPSATPPPPVIQGEGGSKSQIQSPKSAGSRTYDVSLPDRSSGATKFDFAGRAYAPKSGAKPAPFEPEKDDVFD